MEYDAQRTIDLNDSGIRVIRFTNREVINNMEQVLVKISEYIDMVEVDLIQNEKSEAEIAPKSPKGDR